MTEENTSIFTANSVEEAVELGLEQLGLERTQVKIEILEEGNKGLFGIGSRKAQVKISPSTTVFDLVENQENADAKAPVSDKNEQTENDYPEHIQANDQSEELARQTVEDLLDQMGVQASVSAKTIIPEGEDKAVVSINIEGDDLSFLIGRRSETLNAIQYIASLMASKQMGAWVQIQLDVQNYRARRVSELQKLARRMADQVISSGKKLYLEPMPANERRIVHMELRKNEKVRSESFGEEPHRKVGISPK
ncbi:MAG: RNA-binding cell elongation regulator Jag/EloR [Anaerolineaceae bacterium]|nr:RNA-binding cell elongation regulator Jag/EloR [Anaerolineaceae bacterium]